MRASPASATLPRMMALAIATLLLVALVALAVARIAASPLFLCLRSCFDSWAETSRPAAPIPSRAADGA